MNDAASRFDVEPREEAYRGVFTFQNDWALRLFLITAKTVPFGGDDEVLGVIRTSVECVDSRRSAEFLYGRFGFALAHTGRRGISVNITHFGSWGRTFEVFSSAWYTYGRRFAGFELLNDVEPALCWFEAPRAMSEISRACNLARRCSLSEMRGEYLYGRE